MSLDTTYTFSHTYHAALNIQFEAINPYNMRINKIMLPTVAWFDLFLQCHK